MNLFDDLKYRGFVDNITSEDLIDKLNNEKLTFYIGVDPTADSLHIGHLCSLMTAKRLEKAGHVPIIIAGGGTGLIGDPKPTVERKMISKSDVLNNIEALKKQFLEIVGFKTVVNNYDWLGSMNAIDYLRDYGKFFNVNYMIAKDTVKTRLDIGITYTEFSYMILQSIDFLQLYERYNCTLQIGGQDQWGNITAGLELIRKKHQDAKVFGLTIPLITKSDGSKFGKSESGNIWLNKDKTTPYEMYQFCYNTDDERVVEFLKKFTFLSKEEITILENKVKNEPHLREAQKVLAKEILIFIHGSEAYEQVLKISEALFSGNIKNLTENQIEEGFKEIPIFNIENEISILDLLLLTKAASSKREAKELINDGAITINDKRIESEECIVTKKESHLNKYIILKKGKKKYFLIKF